MTVWYDYRTISEQQAQRIKELEAELADAKRDALPCQVLDVLDSERRAKDQLAKLEPIVDLAAKWYLVPGGGVESLHALQDLESALHSYLELT